jgi:hypothetical protein
MQRRTTIRVRGVRVADDLVSFRPAAPNLLWIADMTYLRTEFGYGFALAKVIPALGASGSQGSQGWAKRS